MDLPLKAGHLRHRITFERQQQFGRDALGQVVVEWQPLATVWAAIEPANGRELWHAEQVRAETTHLVQARGRPDWRPTTADRITFAGRMFELVSVIDVQERGIVWRIQAKEAE